jgi:hypothetical protein
MTTLAVLRTGTALHFEGKVTFGDLLTSASVLLAALTLYFSFRQDRVQRRREAADAVRTAAADALAKLERYAGFPAAVAEGAQALVVETSQRLTKPQVMDDVTDARDYLWAELTKVWQEARAAQRAEGIEFAHVKLFGRRPDAYSGIEETIRQLDESALRCFRKLLEAAQNTVINYTGRNRKNYQSAVLGNELRSCLMVYEEALADDSARILIPMRLRLEAVIKGTDRQVVDRGWQASAGKTRQSDDGQ